MGRFGVTASVVALLVAPVLRAAPLDCTATPAGAPPIAVELVSTTESGDQNGCFAEVRGSVDLSRVGGWDVYIILDSSGSTAGASGIDIDGDGVVGTGDWRAPTDPGDSTLQAEIESVRRALTAWSGLDVRVALIEYSAVIPIPPGEPSEQGRIRTVQGLTANFAAVRAGLDLIATAGSVGATDYGGALTELAAEFDRSGDSARWPVAFFLSDGKPTFSRFPYDTTEPTDVAEAMAGAQLLADRGLPVHTLEIGIFDDIGVLQGIANLTGGRMLSGLQGAGILDAIAGVGLEPLEQLELRNLTTNTDNIATRTPAGTFTATIDLQPGMNDLTVVALLETPSGTWTVTCPVQLEAICPRSGSTAPDRNRPGTNRPGSGSGSGGRSRADAPTRQPPGRSGGGGGGGISGRGGSGGSGGGGGARGTHRRWRGFPNQTARDLFNRWGVTECPTLEGNAPVADGCDEALQQLAALMRSIEVGELLPGCALDPTVVPGYPDVDSLMQELRRAIDRDGGARCRAAAQLAALVTSGQAFMPPIVGPAPSGNRSFDCQVIQADNAFDVRVTLDSPTPGSTSGSGDPCPAPVHIEGNANARGNSTYDVYFVLDSSGSTAGDSGRDVDGDGTNDDTLDAELEALRASVSMLDPAITRVALVEFSAVIPIPPGEPNEQGRIRTVQGLTPDFSQFYAGLSNVRTAGSVGATDYGGALLELAAEYDRHGDPTRGHVAFFLSDGKPTFPRFPYDSTEPNDIAYAMQGAQACADRGIVVNTFEVGIFDDTSTLQAVADLTGGRHVGELAGGAIVDALPGSTLVGIESVTIRNELTGEEVTASLRPDGSFDAWIDLAQGANRIVITTRSDGSAEIVECAMELEGDCVNSSECAVRTPDQWHDVDCP
jgi:hypothetical protein